MAINSNTPINLKILEPKDVTQSYVDWFADKRIVQFSDNQYRTFSFEGQQKYVESCQQDPSTALYGIFANKTHIGNICLNGLNSPHKKADLTYVIGRTDYWGKGIGSYAIASIIKLAKETYNLNKLYAGIAGSNIGSKLVLERNKFELEGIRKNHLYYNERFFDQLDYGLLL